MITGNYQPSFLRVIRSHVSERFTRFTCSGLRVQKRSFVQQTLPKYRTSQVQLNVAQDSEDDGIELKLEDHGEYDIIIPQDPIAQSSQRTPTRSVPEHILRPPYVESTQPKRMLSLLNSFVTSSSGCRIPLGGQEEQKIRKAAHLAHRTLAMAGRLVEVSPLAA